MRIVALIVPLLIVAPAVAADFIVCCDGTPPTYPSSAPTLQPDSFSLAFDGKVAVSTPAITQADGSKSFKFDIGPLNLGAGPHTVSVIAIKNGTANSTGGSSPAVNFPFSVGATVAPANVHLSR